MLNGAVTGAILKWEIGWGGYYTEFKKNEHRKVIFAINLSIIS
ncbi:hypothetical protein VVMO6_03632 [Vibrio vulnificus MO6-24/O]|nr:hypothetical protein VVMO6_03632 [Vibrio vulnificus MO6-24/O]